MKNNVRLIKTEAEYETALTRLSDLMDKDIKAGSNVEDELDLLALVRGGNTETVGRVQVLTLI